MFFLLYKLTSSCEESEENEYKGTASKTNTTAKYYKFPAHAKISLCLEVLRYNPYCKNKGQVMKAWDDVTAAFHQVEPRAKELNVSRKRVQAQMDAMIKAVEKADADSLRRSGSEEEYTELHRLLTDIIELRNGYIYILTLAFNRFGSKNLRSRFTSTARQSLKDLRRPF